MSSWRTEQSPLRVAPRERRADVALRRKPCPKGVKLSQGVVDALNSKRAMNKSQRAMRKLLAQLEG